MADQQPKKAAAAAAASKAAASENVKDASPVVSTEHQSSAKTLQLHAAATAGDLARVLVLIKSTDVHPDAVAIDGSGQTALHVAAYNGHPDVLGALIDAGAGIDIRDGQGTTPLHCACQVGDGEGEGGGWQLGRGKALFILFYFIALTPPAPDFFLPPH
jgi:ankyrin repeat protein